MKKTSNNTITFLSKVDVTNLTNVVKETLVLGLTKKRIFSAAELWNIQRRGRTMVSRRYFA